MWSVWLLGFLTSLAYGLSRTDSKRRGFYRATAAVGVIILAFMLVDGFWGL